MLRILPYFIVVAFFLLILLRLAIPYLSPQPDSLGVANGQLAECPSSPNCVSSFATEESHRIDPIAFNGSLQESRSSLLLAIQALPRAEIVEEEPNYLHVITRSRLMGYVDDNEFLIDEKSGTIHVRAAARLGQSDLGANRARIEAIRAEMQ